MTADEIIDCLNLTAHPEGGYYRETFRDSGRLDAAGREASSAIYYLLKAGEKSHWHRIDAAEVWHWYCGAALQLNIRDEGGDDSVHLLGSALAKGERPQIVVPADSWQSACSLGDFTLVGCTVAPAFLFSAFELAGPGLPPTLQNR